MPHDPDSGEQVRSAFADPMSGPQTYSPVRSVPPIPLATCHPRDVHYLTI